VLERGTCECLVLDLESSASVSNSLDLIDKCILMSWGPCWLLSLNITSSCYSISDLYLESITL
jgi:hypothetical protein